jgi:hypothetical protein
MKKREDPPKLSDDELDVLEAQLKKEHSEKLVEPLPMRPATNAEDAESYALNSRLLAAKKEKSRRARQA